MKKHYDQQLVRIKTLMDSNDDDDATSSTSSTSQDEDTDKTSKITSLMRENERKIRSLSESYMNRFLLVGQQIPPSNVLALPSTTRPISASQRKPSETQLEIMTSSPSLTLFIETLKQLIIKEEKKRGFIIHFFLFRLTIFFEFKKNLIYLRKMIVEHLMFTRVSRLVLLNVYVIMKQKSLMLSDESMM